MAVYGPKTTLAISVANPHSKNKIGNCVILALKRNKWQIINSDMQIKENEEGKVFAPGNIKAAFDNLKYKELIDYWINKKYTLRYSGGMVPDVYHIVIKAKGVFCSVSSEKKQS